MKRVKITYWEKVSHWQKVVAYCDVEDNFDHKDRKQLEQAVSNYDENEIIYADWSTVDADDYDFVTDFKCEELQKGVWK